jgi:hypothetical protein
MHTLFSSWGDAVKKYTDSKLVTNPSKYLLARKNSKIQPETKPSVLTTPYFERSRNDALLGYEIASPETLMLHYRLAYDSVDYTSEDLSILPVERNTRLSLQQHLKNLNTTKTSRVLSTNSSSFGHEELFKDLDQGSVTNDLKTRLTSAVTIFPLSHNPQPSTDSNFNAISFDKFTQNEAAPDLLRSKEESAPNYFFETY